MPAEHLKTLGVRAPYHWPATPANLHILGRPPDRGWGRIGRCRMPYQKPEVVRYGTFVELTNGNGANLGGDATSVYHRS